MFVKYSLKACILNTFNFASCAGRMVAKVCLHIGKYDISLSSAVLRNQTKEVDKEVDIIRWFDKKRVEKEFYSN